MIGGVLQQLNLFEKTALVNLIPQVVNAQPGLAAMGSQIFPRYFPPVNVRLEF